MGSQIRHNALENQKSANLVSNGQFSRLGAKNFPETNSRLTSMILEFCHGHGTHTEDEKLLSGKRNHAGAVDVLATVRWCQRMAACIMTLDLGMLRTGQS